MYRHFIIKKLRTVLGHTKIKVVTFGHIGHKPAPNIGNTQPWFWPSLAQKQVCLPAMVYEVLGAQQNLNEQTLLITKAKRKRQQNRVAVVLSTKASVFLSKTAKGTIQLELVY